MSSGLFSWQRVAAACGALLWLVTCVLSQGHDPTVIITETDPPSIGAKVRGELATDILLNCWVENRPPELQVRWQRTMLDSSGRETTQPISNDQSVEDASKWSIEKPTSTSWRLRIKALQVSDEGNYTCFVQTTINNRVESNRTVLALSTPIIMEEMSSSDMTVKEGDFVPLRCNASGRPYPTIIWRRQGNNILPGGGVQHIGPALDVYDISYTARGLYICEALNDIGKDRRDITLKIQHPPKLFADPRSLGQKVGYQRTLTCHCEANPVPSTNPEDAQIWWIKGSERIVADDRRELRYIVGAYNRLTLEMIIYRVVKEDYGTFRCYSKTNLGQGYADVELYETDEPQNDKKNSISAAVRGPLWSAITTASFAIVTVILH